MTNAKTKQNIPEVRNRWMTKRLKTEIIGETLTQKHMQQECDINYIVNAYAKSGNFFHLNTSEPNYGVADPIEFKDAMDYVIDAQNQFNELDSQLRKKFNNDPTTFMEYMHNNPNVNDLIDLGLIDESTMIRDTPAPKEPAVAPGDKEK